MKLTKLTPIIILAAVLSANIFITTPIFAEDVCNSSVPAEVKAAAGCSGNANELPSAITIILNSIILVAGLIAVIFIVIGGYNYMTSAGDPGKTKKAKDTILYAIIGLIVCVLAFAIINFVIGSILNQE